MRIVNSSLLSLYLPCLVALGALAGNVVPTRAEAPAPEGMVLVPAGEFLMGSNQQDKEGADHTIREYSDAYPEHKVNVPAFYMDKTEVTNAQYKKYCDATGYPPPPHWKNGTYAAGADQIPVYNVNWWEAAAYARWAGKRLPSEAEWEKAARGTDGRRYPWGNEWEPARAVWGEKGPLSVGSRPTGASPYGVLDMAGNVMEWVQDWYEAYPGAKEHFLDYGTTYKVVRGGGYMGFEFIAMTYYRCVARPQSRSEWIGFRCAKSAG